uniref:Lipocalin/cytosolic fatty-acid binding domain-containing protein n=1 Tax=Knipowitschia caucasica TaxID=637954 RepID=A0AAV2MRI3_KNICA
MLLVVFLFALTLRFEGTEALSCEELLEPVDDQSEVRGKWFILASTSNNELFQGFMNASLGSWFDITEDGKKTVMIRHDNLNGQCLYRVALLKVLKGQVIYKIGKGQSKVQYTCKFIKTKKESVLGFFCDIDLWIQKKSVGQFIVLLGRTEHPSHKDKKRFEEMVECAGMTNIYYPPNEDMCDEG